jgi:hypothetical protein
VRDRISIERHSRYYRESDKIFMALEIHIHFWKSQFTDKVENVK